MEVHHSTSKLWCKEDVLKVLNRQETREYDEGLGALVSTQRQRLPRLHPAKIQAAPTHLCPTPGKNLQRTKENVSLRKKCFIHDSQQLHP